MSATRADGRLLRSLLAKTARTRFLPPWAHRFVCVWIGFVWSVGTYGDGVEEWGWQVCCRCGRAERLP